jgi:uncharacterized protein
MMMKDRAGLRVLDTDECLQLLDDHLPRVGRVAFSEEGRIVVLPVNYRLDGDAVVFRTGEETTLAGVDGTAVAFQVDEVDATWAEGWSVLVDGMAQLVTDVEEIERLRRLPLHPWAPGEKNRYIRIIPKSVTGRRIE